ncbi:MAG: DHH family phosphoesterase [Candidatus Hadarchaeales archaeon]
MKAIADFLKEVSKKGERVLVLCHENADVDGVASVIVVSEVLNSLGARSWSGCQSLSKLAEHLLSCAGKSIPTNPSFDADYILLLDTSSPEHLGAEFSKKVGGAKLLMVDHHLPVEGVRERAILAYIDETSTSEAELVLRLLKELGVVPTPDQATLLLAGILTDTAELRLAKNQTFEAITELLRFGASYSRAQSFTRLPEEVSRRIAMLKAAKRAEIQEIKGFLVVFSEVGSFEADAAVALLKLGADLAFVGSEEGGHVRVSSRARPELCERTHLNLGQLMMEAARNFKGTGGGHAGAASFTGEGSLLEIRGWLVNRLFEHLVPKS